MSHLITSHKNTDTFIAFLEHLLLTCYPNDKLILVMDNASYHKSRAALAALVAFAHRLRVIWLPTYTPYFNPIERFWLHLKNLASANRLHSCLADLSLAIDQTIAAHNEFSNPHRLSFVHYFQPLA